MVHKVALYVEARGKTTSGYNEGLWRPRANSLLSRLRSGESSVGMDMDLSYVKDEKTVQAAHLNRGVSPYILLYNQIIHHRSYIHPQRHFPAGLSFA